MLRQYSQMIFQLSLGCGLILTSVAIQAVIIGGTTHAIDRYSAWIAKPPKSLRTAAIVGTVILCLTAGYSAAVWLWAAIFDVFTVFPDFDTSLYFSAVTFTTLGFGDITPPIEWRHLAGLCAANGLLIFGISSAALVEVLRKISTISSQ